MGEEDLSINKAPGTDNKQVLPPVQHEKKEPGTNYIIAIGIDNYKKQSLNLPNCVKDCRDLIQTFQNGYEKFEVYKELYNDMATKKAILDTIIAFYKDKTVNNPFNSLVIYFSGHGGFVETPSRKYGSWIPHDYENDADQEFLRLDELKSKLEFLETVHLLVIADCCFSAGMFQYDTIFFNDVTGMPVSGLAEVTFEPSRWGIASSRLNQVAGAGIAGGNSVFTKALIKALNQVSISQVLFREIATALVKQFGTDPVQRVQYKELHVSNENRGEFTLYAKEEPLKAKQRYGYLEKEFYNLNYSKQKSEFYNFNNNRALTLLSGTPDCGLNFVMRQLKNSMSFPAHNCWPVNAQIVDGADEQRLMNLFKMAGKGEQVFDTIDDLKKHLVKKLQENNLVIEIRFYAEAASLGDITQKRKQIIEDLAKFTESVNSMVSGNNRLCVFVIDFEDADYTSIAPNTMISQTKAIIFDKVEKLKKTDFLQWYDRTQGQYRIAPGVRSEFNQLFDDILYKQVEVIFPDAKDFLPGYVIRKICALSNCNELAEKLLY